jgi:hypothetical protein
MEVPTWTLTLEPGSTIEFYSQKPHEEVMAFTGIYSFTLYTRGDAPRTDYMQGFTLYRDLLTKPEFGRVGMVLYTDQKSFPILRRLILTKGHPNMILALVKWIRFYEDETTSESIMRCMRYHATEAFPNAWIMVRDADTIFKLDGRYHNIRYVVQQQEKFFNWETACVKALPDFKRPILLGVGSSPYHHIVSFLTDQNTQTFTTMDAKFTVLAGFAMFQVDRPEGIWDSVQRFLIWQVESENVFHYNPDINISETPLKGTAINGPTGKVIETGTLDTVGKALAYLGKDEQAISFGIVMEFADFVQFIPISYGDKTLINTTNHIPKQTRKTTNAENHLIKQQRQIFRNLKTKKNTRLLNITKKRDHTLIKSLVDINFIQAKYSLDNNQITFFKQRMSSYGARIEDIKDYIKQLKSYSENRKNANQSLTNYPNSILGLIGYHVFKLFTMYIEKYHSSKNDEAIHSEFFHIFFDIFLKTPELFVPLFGEMGNDTYCFLLQYAFVNGTYDHIVGFLKAFEKIPLYHVCQQLVMKWMDSAKMRKSSLTPEQYKTISDMLRKRGGRRLTRRRVR